MGSRQSQGLGGLSFKSTADLSGLVTDVTNGNPIGTTFKNGVGLAVIADVNNDASFVLAADASKRPLGVLGDNPRAGQAGKVESARGTSTKILTGAAVVRGAVLMPDAFGRGITLTAGAHYGYAVAMESASGANLLIEAVLTDEYLA